MYVCAYFQSHNPSTVLSRVCPYGFHCVHRVQCAPKVGLKYWGSGRCQDFGISGKHTLRWGVTLIFSCFEAIRSLFLKIKINVITRSRISKILIFKLWLKIYFLNLMFESFNSARKSVFGICISWYTFNPTTLGPF